jgi:large subunit ribosomal protein L22
MEFTAAAKYVRVSPQKARLVLNLIKGRRVEGALNTLAFTKKGIAPNIHKLLRSAVENANYASTEKGADVDIDNLYVARAIANEGPRMKRIRPAPMGRAYRYQRRMSHIAISIAERNATGLAETVGEEHEAAAPVKKKAAKKTAAKKKAPAKKAAAKKTAAKKAPAKKKAAK